MPGPLLTAATAQCLLDARESGAAVVECSLDLGRSVSRVDLGAGTWHSEGEAYPYPERCRERTVYHWTGSDWEPVARYSGALVKLVPTRWGPPTFEIDGVKMLPTAHVSPYADARDKVARIVPSGRRVLDCCGGLGYFAACCLEAGARHVHSFERSADVLWLRSLNPWSPPAGPGLTLEHADVHARIRELPDASFDAALHDPPRFSLAGELYSEEFYRELARVLRPRAPLFHYTGAPNRVSRGRDLPGEVTRRLGRSGFDAKPAGDGVVAVRRDRHR
jgi:uncharacterized protein